MTVRESLTAALTAALDQARKSGALPLAELPAVQVDVPPSPTVGDFSSDVAQAVARETRQAPGAVAETLAGLFQAPGLVERVEATPSGFLNFRLRADWLLDAVREIRQQREEYGRGQEPSAGPLQVEFVSANPTAPLTLSHGRGAALGDALAGVLEWTGCRVSRETYVNDSGSQMERFGRSLEARYLQAAGRPARIPIDGYADEYLAQLGSAIHAEVGAQYADLPPAERLAAVTRHGRDAVLREQRETLAAFGVRFDEWFSETELHAGGEVDAVLERLLAEGQAYEADGAVWLKSTLFGDEMDRPLRRSNGQPTYLAGDLAYHREKFRRGFAHVLDVWGAEHRGYVGRTLAGLRALGLDAAAVEIRLFESVSTRVEGVRVEASAGRGNNPTLREVVEDVGAGAARFFYLSRPAESELELDLDLAREASARNPYWRFARAADQAAALGAEGASLPAETSLGPLSESAEQGLMRRLSEFPDEVRAAARERDPHRLTRYAGELAGAFDAWARECPAAVDDPALRAARLSLADAADVVFRSLRRVLGLA